MATRLNSNSKQPAPTQNRGIVIDDIGTAPVDHIRSPVWLAKVPRTSLTARRAAGQGQT